MKRRSVWSFTVVSLALLTACAQDRREQTRRALAGVTQCSPTDPCASRNPIQLLLAQKDRDTGKPTTEVFPFNVPFSTDVCVKVTSAGKPRGGGSAHSVGRRADVFRVSS